MVEASNSSWTRGDRPTRGVFQLGHDLLTLLDELSDVPVAWRVEDLRMGSAVAPVAPPLSTEEGRWLRLAVVSLDAVLGGAGLPDDWSPDAVKVAHRTSPANSPPGTGSTQPHALRDLGRIRPCPSRRRRWPRPGHGHGGMVRTSSTFRPFWQ